MSQNFLRRHRRFELNEANLPTIDPVVINWQNRVNYTIVANGGTIAQISASTLIGMTNFYQGLLFTGLINKMVIVNCIAPDNTTAALTPLIDVSGSSRTWVGSGQASQTTLINGLVGNGGGSYWNMQLQPNGLFSTVTSSIGITLYGYSIGNGSSEYDIGTTDGSGTTMLAAKLRDGGTTTFFMNSNTNGGFVTASFAGNGYYSGNRVGRNDLRLYYANSSTTHSQIAANTLNTGIGTYPSYTNAFAFYLGAVYVWDSAATFGSQTNQYSFVAIHRGLSSMESQTLFNLVHSMRKTFGGGWV